MDAAPKAGARDALRAGTYPFGAGLPRRSRDHGITQGRFFWGGGVPRGRGRGTGDPLGARPARADKRQRGTVPPHRSAGLVTSRSYVNFRELREAEVRRIPLPRTPLNGGVVAVVR